jgi:hypothetical protein
MSAWIKTVPLAYRQSPLLLALFGALAPLKEWRKYLVLYLPIVSLTSSYALLAPISRFRIPLEPFILVFASHGVLILWDSFQHLGPSKTAAIKRISGQV